MNFSILTLQITRLMFTHQNQSFRKAIFRPLGVLRPQIFTGLENKKILVTHPPTGEEGLSYNIF